MTDCGGIAASSGPSKVSTAATLRAPARRQHDDLVAGAPDPARDLAGVAAVVVMLVRHRADHPLHREAPVLEVAVGRDLDRLQMLEQRRARVPGHRLAAIDDVVALQRRHRDRPGVVEPEPIGERPQVGLDLREALRREVDEIHLVDRDDDVRDHELRRDVGVAARLLDDAVARVEQDHGDIGGRGAGDHVARVLDVPGRVGELEAAARA